MEMNIGTNIKRLRLAKGLTQEQLAGLLSISTAAVSKWEAKNTYPDITMLFPLAEIFGVSVDELLGYDEEKARKEIDRLIEKSRQLHLDGHFAEASKILSEARKKYPNDYRVMHTYMWDKAGGNAANRSDVLLKYHDEFTQICNRILDGCSEENLRLEALNMKAKLLHAQNDTKGALEVLSQLPTWFGGSEEKKENLFSKDTPEYRYWNKRNCYTLMSGMATKLARIILFDDSLSDNQKAIQLEAMGDKFSKLRQEQNLECFCIVEQMIFSQLAMKLMANGEVTDIIRIREKQFASMEAIMQLAQTDGILNELVVRTYKTENILGWQVDWLLNSAHSQSVNLRKSSKYMEMLLKWKNKAFQ